MVGLRWLENHLRNWDASSSNTGPLPALTPLSLMAKYIFKDLLYARHSFGPEDTGVNKTEPAPALWISSFVGKYHKITIYFKMA